MLTADKVRAALEELSPTQEKVDLAMLMPDNRKTEIGALRKKLLCAIGDIPMSIDLILASEGYAAEFITSINSIYYRILHEGEVVYDSGNR